MEEIRKAASGRIRETYHVLMMMISSGDLNI